MAHLLLPLHLDVVLSHLRQVFHRWMLNAKLSLPGCLLLLSPGKTLGKQHWERGSSPAGQSSVLSFPMFFPESKWAGPKCRARRYQACIQISGTRVPSFGGEKPALVHAINLEREGGGEKVMWSLLQSFLLLLHWYMDHTDRPFDWPAELIENRRKSPLKMPLEVRRTMSAM